MNAPTLTPEQLHAAAVARVRRALELIERAQNDLGSACAELSALEGGVPVWTACHKVADRVRAFWYRVDRFRQSGRFKLDGTHVEALERSHRIAAKLEARADTAETEGCGGDAVLDRCVS